ncbi:MULTISPECIES: alpha/beta fold hydrolase [Thermomonospora]|uniref:Alpha/beta hydrolase fold protein n=1 Tax=Thermomonospora curvata (strain ATCC 19995 / DSM 43183 / JCM 3096 / KCTC 9072 / NBRC 15933 / NCIMB 10081 / Henssen B9) TaxID=471852 RepID=D1ADZ9_THECD|nr:MULTISPECIES: alpha/beta hydrolase [Thermomonospora]ACY99425.1 alpha/beta hydrolase fold protein [Thermomonospora curvata DSM 43183]PKK12471.1 MAG: alpha/beta hydrolase [Thermomonospora sp. CIF 1]
MVVQLYARDVGEGTPLVLLHAFPLSSAMWLAQREGLGGRFRVITPDLRGFGGSMLGEQEPSVDVMADDVAHLLRRKGIDRAVIGGLSMGGYVAMALCRRHPDLVLGLILANTKASADTEQGRRNRLRQAERLEREGTSRVLVEEVLPLLVGPTTMRQRALVYGRVRGLVQAAPAAAAAWAQRAMAARPDSFETLRGVHAPALVITGTEDELSPQADARAMVEALPNAELQVIPRTGHLSAVEQPDLFNQIVAEFVAALARTPR